jgi:hypothetical protein
VSDNPATEEREAAEAAPDLWQFPASLEHFREFIVNTGGNPVEELIRDLDRDKNMMRTNVVRFVLAVAVQSQVALLRKLELDGKLIPAGGAHDMSDGYHTMGELYDHRRALTRALALALGFYAYRSKAHHPGDDPMFEGYFIVGLMLPQAGTVTYHYKLEHWDEFEDVPTLDHALKWDGAQPAASVERLLATRML